MDLKNSPPAPAASHTSVASPHDVLEFWLGDGLNLGWPTQDFSKRWFGGGTELDKNILSRFGDRVAEAVAEGLTNWESEPLSCLALIIVLDQFTRNIFRGSAKAFEGDARSQKLVTDALDKGWDKRLPLIGRIFLLMPLMHAENLAMQEECVRRFRDLAESALPQYRDRLYNNANVAAEHRDIIAKYGRFPYRNAALSRVSTADEVTFLINGRRFGQ